MSIVLHTGAGSDRDWRTRAACLAVDPELFFTDHGEHTRAAKRQIAQAKAVCAECPVRPHCLAWALGQRVAFGVWGGWSEGKRRAMAKSAPASEAVAA
jgi:WhiB family redox-sensing transcriptional regulator